MRSFGGKNKILLATALTAAALTGCQTTTNNSFSSWKSTSLVNARFNMPNVLNVPISEVQQRSRNNGQVLDEDWWLGCGDGQIHIEHVPVSWFNTGTINTLKDKNAFADNKLKSATKGSSLKDITSIETVTLNRVGYYADLVKPDGKTCQVAKFGIRAKQKRVYDNDKGAVDTYIDLSYCGEVRLDMAALTSNLKLAKDDEAYGSSVNNGELEQCPAVFQEAAATSPLSQSRKADLTVVWPGSYRGNQPLSIRHNDTSGVFSIVLSESNSCDGHYESVSPETPLKARWWLSCSDGSSAKGYFYPETSQSLFGKGQDEKGVEILLGIELITDT
jgi:hypothetical protein